MRRGDGDFATLARRARRYLARPGAAARPPGRLRFANADLPEEWSRGHFALLGATGSGKSTLLEILLRSAATDVPEDVDVWNMFIADPQNDLHRALLSMGLPVDIVCANVFDRRAWGWDIWRDLTEPAAAEQFAHDLVPREKASGENRYFEDAPRILLASVLRELVNRKLRWSLLEALLLTLNADHAARFLGGSGDEAVRMSLRLLSDDQGPTRANLDSSVLVKLRKLLTYAALLDRARDRFSVGELVAGDVVLVAGGDFEHQDVLNPAYNLMFTCLKNRLIGQDESRRRRHWVVMDEFAAVNGAEPATAVRDFFERGRSRGCRVVITAHGPQQLREIYGPERTDVILGMCQHKLIGKISDPEGAEYCSKLLGNVHGHEWTNSYNWSSTSSPTGPSKTTGYSASEQRVDYPEVHRSEVLQLPLASFERGFRGYALVTGETKVHKWRYSLAPGWLAEHAAGVDERIPTYRECRRDRPEDQVVRPLTETRLRYFGVDPSAHDDDGPADLVPWVMNPPTFR